MKWLALAYAAIGIGVGCLDYSDNHEIFGAIGMGLILFGPLLSVTCLIYSVFKYLDGTHLTDKKD